MAKRCADKRKDGKPCRAWPVKGSEFCGSHAPDAPPKKWEARFLEVFAEWGIVKRAATAAGVSHTTVYRRKEASQAFAEAFDEAEELSTQRMEEEAFRRAVVGWEEPVFYQGDEVAQVRKYDTTLLIFMLKARRPETYRDRLEVRGNVTHEHRSEIDEKVAELVDELGSLDS